MSVKNNITDSAADETLLVVDAVEATVVEAEPEEEGNAGCQVRRKIEDYLERRRYKDELGELG